MSLPIVAFLVCLLGAGILYGAGRFTEKMRFSKLALLTLPALAAYGAVLHFRPRFFLLADLVVLAAALCLGSLLGHALRGTVGLASFLIAAAIFDVVSSTSGATARLTRSFHQGGGRLLPYLGMSLPVAGRTVMIVGIADLLILAAIYFALRRLGWTGPWVFAAPALGLLLAVAAGLVFGGMAAVPFIAAGTLAYLGFAFHREPSP